ncbi:restriction endonuclease subunit S [Campylobacter jejuni]|uniref:restriction endonuclease subunit S n=1 Tax=Campylobacter jejuni TaxID=197 RepID=UPI000F80421A|nr:restriction endonuclease subunit S [Campylobacter jejuni]HEE9581362.1 restriction endonuclease subunit S [Campylobacter jejuni subsp. jejuni]EAJ3285992.1 restriction endonuclease subunit S [Campylobacter jejuni]EAK2291772.1 restriction endonuclease subunit S [Campylobacter jejuni]EAK8298467.1 restriction endonuclease subunit S [Campylobacter jejuni]EAL0482576.1 restriction endonuclease subunit S [Campylobacter jejuni]
MKIKIWKINKLEKICEILDNKRVPISQKDRISGIYPYYGASGIVDYIDKYIFDEELVLIGEDGAKWDAFENSAFIASGKYWVNNHAHILKPNNEILINKFLVYFLNYSNLEKYITGATVKKLNQQKLKQIEIPLPPLKEQERIVGILDESFAKIDESIKILEQNLLNLDELMQSALQKAFNPLKDNAKENYKLPQGWEWKSLGDISNYGKTSQVKPSQLKGNDWILELEDIEKESGVLLQKVLFQDRQSKSNKIKFNKGDILFGTLRPYLKKVIIANDNGACSSEIMPFSTGNSIANHFIYYYLFANFLHDRISSLTYGARMPRLGTKDGKSLQIPLPPLKEQEQIAEHLDFVFEKAKALKELYTKELKDYEELKQSLLDKAFKGEL